ncbi:hypothetical protein LHFGNBLO_002534 [Mesorhizobium sp. AR10]|uniref:hypothetical protein n=1 Tax=Mesorhizobium sp. AR10 TaxID=2865839 RepID=UPI00215FBE4D|nr:hypothetical protein [Mesorhizobium sp. AR10]UVK40994.1 hypothetical protein LHFGNBLO_002534 [Mesorhizobium sp. AR10]
MTVTVRRSKPKTPKPWSWTTRRRFKCASHDTHDFAKFRNSKAISDCYGTMGMPDMFPGRNYLPGPIIDAVIRELVEISLPSDRYDAWKWHGRYDPDHSRILVTLRRFRILGERAELIRDALWAIEPYPSKKWVEYSKIDTVLEEVGRLVAQTMANDPNTGFWQ